MFHSFNDWNALSHTAKLCIYIGSSSILILLCTTFYDIYKKVSLWWEKKNSKSLSPRAQQLSRQYSRGKLQSPLVMHVTIYFEITLIVSHMLLGVISLLSSHMHCKFIMNVGYFLFHFSGAFLYLILVRRIQISYTGTMFALSPIGTSILYGSLALYVLPFLVYVDWFVIDSVHCTLVDQWQSTFPLILAMSMHALIAMYALKCFLYPLRCLSRQQEGFNQPEVSHSLYFIMIKYAVLYSSSILSSLILIVLYLFSPQMEIAHNYCIFHSFINGMVLLLLHPAQNPLYVKLCCGPNYLCWFGCALLRKQRPRRLTPDEKMMVDIQTGTQPNTDHGVDEVNGQNTGNINGQNTNTNGHHDHRPEMTETADSQSSPTSTETAHSCHSTSEHAPPPITERRRTDAVQGPEDGIDIVSMQSIAGGDTERTVDHMSILSISDQHLPSADTARSELELSHHSVATGIGSIHSIHSTVRTIPTIHELPVSTVNMDTIPRAGTTLRTDTGGTITTQTTMQRAFSVQMLEEIKIDEQENGDPIIVETPKMGKDSKREDQVAVSSCSPNSLHSTSPSVGKQLKVSVRAQSERPRPSQFKLQITGGDDKGGNSNDGNYGMNGCGFKGPRISRSLPPAKRAKTLSIDMRDFGSSSGSRKDVVVQVDMEKLWSLRGELQFEKTFTLNRDLETIGEDIESLPSSPDPLCKETTWSTIHKEVADQFQTAVVNTLRFIDSESMNM